MRRRGARGKDFGRGLRADWAELPARAASYETGEFAGRGPRGAKVGTDGLGSAAARRGLRGRAGG